ncbi:hypothetical protein KAR91_87005 [Candidatus Pacearchaeota archaeon]|nr:hypothetical protein [Candidatus Pacearchaeota archaeon]
MNYDELEKKYTKQFMEECKKLNLRSTKRDAEGVPTLYPSAKKNKWYCQAWGTGSVSLSVFDPKLAAKGETLHGKTLNAVLRKFLTYVPDKCTTIDDLDDPGVVARLKAEGIRLFCGDTEANIVFPLSKLKKVAHHFGMMKRKATEAQLAHRARFGQMMKERKEKEIND